MRKLLEELAERFSGKGIDKKFPFFVWFYKKLFVLFSSETETEVSTPLDLRILVSTKDSGLGLTLRTKGKFEPVQTRKFINKVKKGDVVFDVGANVGYYTVLASKLVGKHGKVYAFEPEKGNLRLLRKNIRLNGCQNVTVCPFALGERDQKAFLLKDRANPGESRISRKRGESVAVKAIDAFVREKKIKRIDVLKIDVEGAEFGVLAGAKKTLRRQTGPKIFIELNPKTLSKFGHTATDLTRLLARSGFKLERIINENSQKSPKFSLNSLEKALKGSSFVVLYGEKNERPRNKKPLVSVVITAFNAEKYIAPALESIIGQTYKNLEIVVVDDGSKDATFAIVKRYAKLDPRIKLIRMGRNLGPSKASNSGIRKTRGEFIARMDADDIARPDRIEKQVNFLRNNLDVVIVGGQCDLIDAEGNLIGEKKFPTKHTNIYRALFVFNSLPHPACMIRRRALPASFTFYHNHFVLSHDLELVFELAGYGRLANLDEKVLFYRQHLDSLSLRNPKETFKSTLAVRAKAVRRYGYSPSVTGLVANFIQTIIVFALPEKLIFPVFLVVRGLTKHSFLASFPRRLAPAFDN